MQLQLKWIGLALLVVLASQTSSALYYHYPTQWKIENKTGTRLFLECESKIPMGLSQPIQMHTDVIGAYLDSLYSWHGWYNDGLGLNRAEWTCALGTKYRPIHVTPQSKVAQTQFSTRMGEDITLSITRKNNQIQLQATGEAK